MFFKIAKGSQLFNELFDIINGERERYSQFREWQVKNLPEFNNEVLTQHSAMYLYADVVAWKFVGEFDIKTWQEVKGWKGYYEPKRRTKSGKEMAERITIARGKRFCRLQFFDIFKTSIPIRRQSFIVPTGFIHENVIYMSFDDRNYKDIKDNFEGHFIEITHGEWEEVCKANIVYNK